VIGRTHVSYSLFRDSPPNAIVRCYAKSKHVFDFNILPEVIRIGSMKYKLYGFSMRKLEFVPGRLNINHRECFMRTLPLPQGT